MTINQPSSPDCQRRRRLGALAALLVAVAVLGRVSAQMPSLQVERDGDRLRLSAPGIRLLSGAPLDRLRDGRSVVFVLTATLEVDRGQPRKTQVTRQVVFSYDLWEERFAVAQADAEATKPTASHLTSAAAEAWSMDLLALPLRLVPADGTFVIKFECRLRDDREQASDAATVGTLGGLIDLFSRSAREEPPRWEAVSPRLRLSDLKDKASR